MTQSLSSDDLRTIIHAASAKYPLAGYFMEKLMSEMAEERADNQSSRGKKRKAESAIAVCEQCSQPFFPDDEVDSRKGECVYHPGELEPDYDCDLWADHDESCHGTIDTDEMREEYPQGFTWDCCERLGNGRGCKRGRHCKSRAEASKAFENGDNDDDTGPEDRSDEFDESSESE